VSIIEKAVDKRTVDGRLEPEEKVSEHPEAIADATELDNAQPVDVLQPGSETADPGEPPPIGREGDEINLPGAATSEATQGEVGAVDVGVSFADLGLEGLLSPEGDRSRAAEEYRMIKRPLLVPDWA